LERLKVANDYLKVIAEVIEMIGPLSFVANETLLSKFRTPLLEWAGVPENKFVPNRNFIESGL